MLALPLRNGSPLYQTFFILKKQAGLRSADAAAA